MSGILHTPRPVECARFENHATRLAAVELPNLRETRAGASLPLFGVHTKMIATIGREYVPGTATCGTCGRTAVARPASNESISGDAHRPVAFSSFTRGRGPNRTYVDRDAFVSKTRNLRLLAGWDEGTFVPAPYELLHINASVPRRRGQLFTSIGSCSRDTRRERERYIFLSWREV